MSTEESEIFALAKCLKEAKDAKHKVAILLDSKSVKKNLCKGQAPSLWEKCQLFEDREKRPLQAAFLATLAISQEDRLFACPAQFNKSLFHKRFKALLQTLQGIDENYSSIGGIVGYHAAVLHLLFLQKNGKGEKVSYSSAQSYDLCFSSDFKQRVVARGIQCLPEIGEIYPVGGLGDRLGLKDRFGIPLPAASLPFNGKNLLALLVEDLIGKEYLYFKLFGHQLKTPIALMTSHEKENHSHIKVLLEKHKWFGRGREGFFLFKQPSAPVLDEEGNWILTDHLSLKMEPSGHGAMWSSALNEGVFDWFLKLGKSKGIVRQINNPIGGTDDLLLGLAGVGKEEKKAFGFASCGRLVNAAEGMLVLAHRKEGVTLSNIEYTDFAASGIEDRPATAGSPFSCFPANTNLIFFDLKKALPLIRKIPLPGLMINMKGKDEKTGLAHGRLESMMQSLSDFFPANQEEKLATFLTYNRREKTISAAKKQYLPGKSLLETPQGAFYDFIKNGHTLLTELCGVACPLFGSLEDYLEKGPTLIFTYHPALGPLWEVIAQKIRGGLFENAAELRLEIAEAYLANLTLKGSLLISAKHLAGIPDPLEFSDACGRCELIDVKIRNKGIDRKVPQSYWKGDIKRKESCSIYLEGQSEFYAKGVEFIGDINLKIPDKQRWVALKGERGIDWIKESIDAPSWRWKYTFSKENKVVLERQYAKESAYHITF